MSIIRPGRSVDELESHYDLWTTEATQSFLVASVAVQEHLTTSDVFRRLSLAKRKCLYPGEKTLRHLRNCSETGIV